MRLSLHLPFFIEFILYEIKVRKTIFGDENQYTFTLNSPKLGKQNELKIEP